MEKINDLKADVVLVFLIEQIYVLLQKRWGVRIIPSGHAWIGEIVAEAAMCEEKEDKQAVREKY